MVLSINDSNDLVTHFSLFSNCDPTYEVVVKEPKWRKVVVEYTKEQHLYRILAPSAYILLSFYIRIHAFERFCVFGLVQVVRVSCIIVIRVHVQRANMDHCR